MSDRKEILNTIQHAANDASDAAGRVEFDVDGLARSRLNTDAEAAIAFVEQLQSRALMAGPLDVAQLISDAMQIQVLATSMLMTVVHAGVTRRSHEIVDAALVAFSTGIEQELIQLAGGANNGTR